MIITHEYPVCEYDTARDPIIHPTDFLDKCLPKKCIITFFRKELEKFAGEHKLPVIGQLHSEVLDIPIYKYENGENPLCITMPFSTAPGAAGTIGTNYTDKEGEKGLGEKVDDFFKGKNKGANEGKEVTQDLGTINGTANGIMDIPNDIKNIFR